MPVTARLLLQDLSQSQAAKEIVINANNTLVDAAVAAQALANTFLARNDFTQTPTASANHGVVNIGTLGFAGGGGTAFAGDADGQYIAGNIPLSFAGLYAELQADGLSVWRLLPTGILVQTAYDAAATAISFPYAIRHGISTAATGGSIGIGSGIGLEVESGTDGTFINIGAIAAQTTAVGVGTQSSNLQLKVRQAGALVTPFTIDAANITLADPMSYVLGTTTGVKWGTATGQKQAWWGATPVVQQVMATGTGKTVDNVLTMLQTLGICKQS